jgi:hypothetical protein
MKNLFLLFFLFAAQGFGATYYVDCNADGDAGAGTSTAANVAWKTIAKVNASSFSAGDSILFNRGCTWREILGVPNSGILFGAYGTGANPLINGSTQLSSWTQIPGGYDWSFTEDGSTPWDWTAESDASNLIATETTTVHDAQSLKLTINSTATAYVEKTSLTSSSAWYFKIWFYISDGTVFHNTEAGRSVHFIKLRKNTTDIVTVYLNDVDRAGIYRFLYEYNRPSNANWTGNQNFTTGGWHSLKVWGTNLNTTGGTWNAQVDGVTDGAGASGLDFTASNGDVNGVRVGAPAWGSGAVPSGSYFWDDGYFDQDDISAVTNKWYATLTGTKDVVRAWEGSTELLSSKANTATMGSYGDWYYDNANDLFYIYKTSNPDVVEVTQRSGILIISTDNNTFQDIDIEKANTGFDISTSTGLLIQRCNVTKSGYYGVFLDGVSGTISSTDVNNAGYLGYLIRGTSTITLNSSSVHETAKAVPDGTEDGLYIQGSATVTATNFTSYNNSGDGVSANQTSILKCYSCKSYNNGIVTDAVGSGDGYTNHDTSILWVISSLAYGNLKSGIALIGASGNIYNNSIYDNFGTANAVGSSGIIIYGGTWNIKNNVTANHSVEINHQAGTIASDYNNFYPSRGLSAFKYSGSAETNFVGWKTASSQDGHSIITDPLFLSTTDFHLQGNSPAINAGVDVGLTTDIEGKAIKGLPDIGAYEYQGSTYRALLGVGQ